MVKETHFANNNQQMYQNEWGGPMVCVHGESNARGVAILFRQNLDLKICKTTRCNEGRYILCVVEINEKKLLLINVYTPNHDNPMYFVNLFEVINKQKHVDCIIMGDFNLVLEPSLDSHKRVNNNKKLAKGSTAIP